MKTLPFSLIAFLLIHTIGFRSSVSSSTPETTCHPVMASTVPFVNSPAILPVKETVNFYYEVSTRFRTNITPTALKRAATFQELLPDQSHDIDSVHRVDIFVMDDQYNTIAEAKGVSDRFSEEQLELLQAMVPSTDFRLHVEYEERDPYSGIMRRNYMTPHITVVPEQQARYSLGLHALRNHLEEESRAATAHVQQDLLQTGRIFFSVSASGTLEDIRTESSCGYTMIDALMHNLIKDMPGTWTAAKDAQGEPTAQAFVFVYGQGGC